MSEHTTQDELIDDLQNAEFCALAERFGPGVVAILNDHKPLLHLRGVVRGKAWYIEAIDMRHEDTTLYIMPEETDD